jgi:hypothetical protein
VHLVELPVYVLAAIVLGVQFGLAGFAAAFALRCAVDCGVMMVRCGLHKRLPARFFWPSALIILLAVISSLAIDEMIIRLVVGAGLTVASLVVAVATLAQEQSARIRDISARLLRFQA